MGYFMIWPIVAFDDSVILFPHFMLLIFDKYDACLMNSVHKQQKRNV